jgi:hypothetical protein
MSARRESTATKPFSSGRDCLIKTALSELAKLHPGDYVDPEVYATRPTEARKLKSIEEGKISRPLNSYMLYRKAYQQVARRALRNDQQQHASQAVGLSWNQYEGADVKAKFKALARTDHKMHHDAFPGYKYTPTQGKNSRSSAADSRRLSSSIERRLYRRSGTKESGTHGTSGKNIIRPTATEPFEHQRPAEGNINMNWWPQEVPGFTTPSLHHGGRQVEHYEPYLMPESTYFDPHCSDVLDDNTFSHLQRQPTQLVTSPAECLSLESCIDPSLFSRFEGGSIPQNASRYMEWQSQEGRSGHEYHPMAPDMNIVHPAGPRYEEPEEWPVPHVDESRDNQGWQTIGENRHR